MARWLEMVPLDDLLARPAPRNAKRHDEQGIRESITRHGFVENPAIDERTGLLVAGHGRLTDLGVRRSAGEAPPDGVEVADDGTWMVPVQRGWASRSDSDAEAYLVASNELTIRGGWDEKMLAEMFDDYQTEPEWLLGTGYDEKQVVSFLASVGQLPDDESAPDQTGDLSQQWSVVVDVPDDFTQRDLIARLEGEGFRCRALTT